MLNFQPTGAAPTEYGRCLVRYASVLLHCVGLIYLTYLAATAIGRGKDLLQIGAFFFSRRVEKPGNNMVSAEVRSQHRRPT